MREIKRAGQPHSIAGIQVFCLKISCSPPLPFSGISQVSLPQNAKSHDQEPTATGFSTPPLARLLLMLPQRCWRQGQGRTANPMGTTATGTTAAGWPSSQATYMGTRCCWSSIGGRGAPPSPPGRDASGQRGRHLLTEGQHTGNPMLYFLG